MVHWVCMAYVADAPGVSLVGFHYSVNSPLQGIAAGQHAYDINTKTGASSPATGPS